MRYGQGPPPTGGWKRYMTDDEYSPEHQDEYRRLWHEAAAERDRLREFLQNVNYEYTGAYGLPWRAWPAADVDAVLLRTTANSRAKP